MAQKKFEYWLTEDGLKLIQGWARDGLDLDQIAHNMGIIRPTLYTWRKKYESIESALKKGKEVVDLEVENALFKRAVGYRYDETTSERKIDPSTGKPEMVVTKMVTKDVPPDVAAAFIWLKNRMPGKWRDKVTDSSSAVEGTGLTEAIKQSAQEVFADEVSSVLTEADESSGMVGASTDQ